MLEETMQGMTQPDRRARSGACLFNRIALLALAFGIGDDDDPGRTLVRLSYGIGGAAGMMGSPPPAVTTGTPGGAGATATWGGPPVAGITRSPG